MSAAASRLELGSPKHKYSNLAEETAIEGTGEIADEVEDKHERELLEKLTGIAPADPSIAVIAIDLDDVLSVTNPAVAEWHNEMFGTNMDISTFYYYYYWKNPYWGTPKETFDKVTNFYKTDRIFKTTPLPGARLGVQTLKDMGFRLVIVTARQEDNADESWKWVSRHFPGVFDSIICTGQFKEAHRRGHEVVTKLTKSQVCADLGAKLLIDDSAENALHCATAQQPTPVLLFGDYEWNQRISGPGDACDELSFDIRFKASGGKEFWKEETVPIPDEAPLWRVRDWSEVVEWVEQAKAEGRL